MVISIVAKESLGDAIGGTVRSLGSMHQRLPAGGSFPHTEHQRQLAGDRFAFYTRHIHTRVLAQNFRELTTEVKKKKHAGRFTSA